MTQIQSSTLTVPGATIYYEHSGTGPVAVFIPGGAQDAGVFAGIIGQLNGRYTALTFDPRGNSRSIVDNAKAGLDIDVFADDVAAHIVPNGGAPAVVFGTSGGAHIGLSLAARHPTLVKTLIAHEPPTMMLLPDPEASLAGERALYETYRKHDVEAAMGQFFAENGLMAPSDDPPPMPSPAHQETLQRVSGNFEYSLAHGMMPVSTYLPDVDALASGKPRIVVAIGELSVDQPIAAMSRALAESIGVDPVVFPGDHMGFAADAARFARRIDEIFTDPSSAGV